MSGCQSRSQRRRSKRISNASRRREKEALEDEELSSAFDGTMEGMFFFGETIIIVFIKCQYKYN
jgi:hypothetical protein